MQGAELRQGDAAVAPHGYRDRTVFGDTANRLLDPREGLVDDAWRNVDVPAIDHA